MEVLEILLILALIGVAIFLLLHAVAWAGIILMIASAYVPALAGIVCGVLLWQAGHDNLGVATGIAGIVGNFFWYAWWKKMIGADEGGSSYDPMEDKKKRYDKDGNVIGYEDRE